MNKILVLITSTFPYGTGETFLESEVLYYDKFDKVFIFPIIKNIRGAMRKVPENCHVCKINNSADIDFHRNLFSVLNEYLYIKGDKILLSSMYDFYKVASNDATAIKKELIRQGIGKNDRIAIYSYWMHTHALTAVFLKRYYKNSLILTRCHRYDIFEEINPNNYLPFRKLILTNIDVVLPISQSHKYYLLERYYKFRMNIKVSYLGTENTNNSSINNIMVDNKDKLSVVSCSNVIPLKRVEKIVEVLSKIKDTPIRWTHIGDGSQMFYIKKISTEKLIEKASFDLVGHVTNTEVRNMYDKNTYHVFLHLSESEGLPVSFMEAMSYGIPVIATDVGGVSEIVSHGYNGYLVNKNLSIESIIGLLQHIYTMPLNEYNQLRSNAYKTWKNKFNANRNYSKFANNLLKTIERT